jgi:hypothetical protein
MFHIIIRTMGSRIRIGSRGRLDAWEASSASGLTASKDTFEGNRGEGLWRHCFESVFRDPRMISIGTVAMAVHRTCQEQQSSQMKTKL